MTNEEAIKMLQTEKACVERQERKQNCNRYCESCDLCMPIEDVIEGYNVAIRALKNEQTDGELQKEIDFWHNRCTEYEQIIVKIAIESNDVKAIPSAEKTAEWKALKNVYECSNCGVITIQKDKRNYEYCPKCKARMKEVEQ